MSTEKKRRYKAKVAKTAPEQIPRNFSGYDSGMLGLSLGSRNSEEQRLSASLDFMQERFERSAVIVGDGLYHLTLQINEGMSDETSKTAAITEGIQHYRRNKSLYQFYEENGGEVIFLSSIRAHHRFLPYLKQMQLLLETSASFQREVSEFTTLYLARVLGSNRPVIRDSSSLHLARQYLLEECALFACLQTMGWKHFVYGGSLGTFESIASGKIEGMISPLADLPFISLKFESRGWVTTPLVETPVDGNNVVVNKDSFVTQYA